MGAKKLNLTEDELWARIKQYGQLRDLKNYDHGIYKMAIRLNLEKALKQYFAEKNGRSV